MESMRIPDGDHGFGPASNWVRVRTVQIVRTPSPSSREGTADSSQMQAGSECPAAPGSANSMGSRALERIPAQVRNGYDSMPWVRQLASETFRLCLRSEHEHSGTSHLLTLWARFYHVVMPGRASCRLSDVTHKIRKGNATRRTCQLRPNFLIAVSASTMSTGEENSGWNLTESGI